MRTDNTDIIKFVVKRILGGFIILGCLVTFVFIMAHMAPGNPVSSILSPTIPPSVGRELQKNFGLDKPLVTQYMAWIKNCFSGNLGISITHRRPVSELIGSFLPNTVILTLAALVMELVIGISLGIISIRHPNNILDRCISQTSLLLFTIPTFWIGLVLLALFSFSFRLFPSSQMFSINAGELSAGERFIDFLKHITLPALTVAFPGAAAMTRFFRTNLSKLQNEEFITYARSFGISKRRLSYYYELPNALGPVLTLVGLELGTLLTGALVTETIFSWPGMGRLTVMAIVSRDYPLIMGCTIVSGVVVIIGNFVADFLYVIIDPRIRMKA